MSYFKRERLFHGIFNNQSIYVRATVPSDDIAGIDFKRFNSVNAFSSASFGIFASRIFSSN